MHEVRDGIGGRIGKWIDNHGLAISVGVVPMFAAICAVATNGDLHRAVSQYWGDPKSYAWLILVGAAGLVIFTVGDLVLSIKVDRVAARNRSLEEENRCLRKAEIETSQDVLGVLQSFLRVVAAKLSSDEEALCNTRVSFYSYNSTHCSFVRLARYSLNPDWVQPASYVYNHGQGHIGIARRDGESFDNNYPDPTEDLEGYIDHHAQYDFPRELVQGLRMRSRLYYAKRVQSQQDDVLGVIVVESTNPQQFAHEELQNLLADDGAYLSGAIERLGDRLPNPHEAQEAGF